VLGRRSHSPGAELGSSNANGLALMQAAGVDEKLEWAPAPCIGASPRYVESPADSGVLMEPVVTRSTTVRVPSRL